MNNNELIAEFYGRKNYSYLKEKLVNSANDTELYYLARVFLKEKKYDLASSLFKKLGCDYEYGRCELLTGNYDKAAQIWNSIEMQTPATLWGNSLLQFINLYVINIPSFFQIRAFLEVDLNDLLNAGQLGFAENIANGSHLFAQNNQESFKFIGRVFFNNNYIDISRIYLERAKDVCYADPEVHYLLAKCYIHNNDIKKAKESLITSVDKGFGYLPARKLLEQLQDKE